MDKLQLAHEYALEMAKQGMPLRSCLGPGWRYADAMQAEAEKRNKAEAEQKRKEIREILSGANTFIEREGQHFDDVEEWQPDWSQAPAWANWWAMHLNVKCEFFEFKPYIIDNFWCGNESNERLESPSFDYQGNWKESLRKRPQ